MPDSDSEITHQTSDGGIAGNHPDVNQPDVLVATSTANELNTARMRVIPIACWRVDDIRFAFDSSFVTPDVATELNILLKLREAKKKSDLGTQKTAYPPLAVFGHADPVGSDDYNKSLSGRRATVVYALLISNSDQTTAVRLWKSVAQTENWGSNQRQKMQAVTGLPSGTPDNDLFKAYMQKLMPPELQLSRTDFIGQGADAGGKADYQGCSEFNPLLIFSQNQENQFQQSSDKTARNAANASNRRVLVLLFRPGTRVDPAKWPCPRATDGVTACHSRFWSDGETRRSMHLPDTPRSFEATQNTFACRFYQRLVTNSPCEAILQTVRLRLFDRLAHPLPFAPCVVTEQGQEPRPDRASGSPPDQSSQQNRTLNNDPNSPGGTPAPNPTADNKQDGFIMVRVHKIPTTINVKWSPAKPGDSPNAPPPKPTDDFEFEMDVTIDIPDDTSEKSSITRLTNLGYIQFPDQTNNVRAFQSDYQQRFPDITVNGTLDDATTKAIKTVHDACDPVVKGKGASQ